MRQYDVIWAEMQKYARRNPEQRAGQAYYNYVRTRYENVFGQMQERQDEISWDCFNDDALIPAFIVNLKGACDEL